MSGQKACPECGHQFQGNGWDGIDAHWKSPRVGHEHVMPYKEAWPIIRAGGRPSDLAGERQKPTGLSS